MNFDVLWRVEFGCNVVLRVGCRLGLFDAGSSCLLCFVSWRFLFGLCVGLCTLVGILCWLLDLVYLGLRDLV